jgi:Sulfotransferase family
MFIVVERASVVRFKKMLSNEMEKAKGRRIRDQRQQPIFMVGCPRSGTTLLASFLGVHSRLICGPETEFFTGLQIAKISAAQSSGRILAPS